uniref:[histone H3]-dimethyl-L-lysine(9) demethylase n=1 Tax=Strigamia maritima TaxID=126957 RepID=T1J383_STRMM
MVLPSPPSPSMSPKISEIDRKKSRKRKNSEILENPKKMKKIFEPKSPEKKSTTKPKRKVRCKQCENCIRPDCGKCSSCLDMRKFGGPQVWKQCCKNRICLYRETLPERTVKPKPPPFTLTPALQQHMDSKQAFLQDEPCWKLPLKQYQCRQCAKDCLYGPMDAIMCRFNFFRKLKFNDDDILTPVGFEENATIESDLRLLTPNCDEPADLDLDSSKYILNYVIDQFCGLVEEEKRIGERFSQKDVVLKRGIQGVREMCDVCNTTIFNFHFTCAICGFVVCIDCYDSDEVLWMACNRSSQHLKKRLMLTQTLPGDILGNVNRLAHEICKKNEINTNCACVSRKIEFEDESNGICEHLMDQISEIPVHEASESPPSNGDIYVKDSLTDFSTILYCVIDHFYSGGHGTFDCERFLIDNYPLKKRGKEFSSRIFTSLESRSRYPEIPHSWLCDGHLLCLHEPQNPQNVRLFQEMWERGQPVLISNVHQHLDENLWSPKSFSRDFGELENDLIDCLSGSVIHERMKNFWDGFEDPKKRLQDENGRYRLLKLKDWPPGDDFSEVMPSRFDDLMKALPLPDYTCRDGKLNLTARLPNFLVPPDLGPKMYIAYGSTQYPSQGTTNLHLDMSDAVNVMVYAGILKDEDVEEAFQVICDAGCDVLTRKRVKEESVKLGALWHIFKSNDAPKIREFLNELAIENGEKAQAKSDPIHDQRWYLDSDMRNRLYTMYGVEGYAIAQCVGDAVFIPAGAPHQVRNLHSCIKVAEDFVTPENVGHCLKLTQEFRHLSNSHTNHEDKLQVKNIVYHSVKDSLSVVMANEGKKK